MKKIMAVLFACAVTLPLLSQGQTKVVRLTRYAGEKITGVSASSAFRVELVRSDDTRAVVEIDERLEDRLAFSLSGGVVKVGLTGRSRERYRKPPVMKLTVYLPTLTLLKAPGATDIYGKGLFTADNTVVTLSGASDLKELELHTGTLTLGCSGASDADLTVKAGTIKCTASGASDVDLKADGGFAEINASGASDTDLTGTLSEAKFTASGASEIDAYGCEIKKVTANASGASGVKCWVTESLDATASSASSVKYRGNPTVFNKKSSGGSSVKKAD